MYLDCGADGLQNPIKERNRCGSKGGTKSIACEVSNFEPVALLTFLSLIIVLVSGHPTRRLFAYEPYVVRPSYVVQLPAQDDAPVLALHWRPAVVRRCLLLFRHLFERALLSLDTFSIFPTLGGR